MRVALPRRSFAKQSNTEGISFAITIPKNNKGDCKAKTGPTLNTQSKPLGRTQCNGY